MDKNRKKDKHQSLIIGLILIGIGTLLMLIMTGVFGASGEYVKNFFLGTFGLSFYGLTVACLLIGVLKLFKFKLGVPVSKLIEIIGIYVLFVLAFHATSHGYVEMTNGYGEYIAKCYSMADTAGGVLAAIVMYPLLKLNYVFAIVLVALLLFGLIAFAMFGGRINLGTVRTRSVKYSKKDKIKEEEPTHVHIDNTLKNEDVDGNKLKDFKARSRFSKSQVEYTPIEEVDDLNDDEFRINYKDNYAFDSSSEKEPNPLDNVEKDISFVDDNASQETNKFERMRNEARIAREKLYGNNDDKIQVDNNNSGHVPTDKEKFKEAIDKIRNNEDPTYLYNLTNNNDDYEMYSIEARQKIFEENMRKEREEAKLRDENATQDIINSPIDDNVEEEEEFNVEDFNISDENNGNSYSFDNFNAFSESESNADNVVADKDDTLDAVDKDDIIEEVVVEEDNENVEDSLDEVKDESVNYHIDDFSDSLDKSFGIENKEDSPYDLPFYSRDEMYLKDDKTDKEGKTEDVKPVVKPEDTKKPVQKSESQDRVKDIESELMNSDEDELVNGRKRRSDFGGTHNSQHPVEEKQESTPTFINPFLGRVQEEKVEDVKAEEVQEVKPYVAKLGYKYKAPTIDMLNDYEVTHEDQAEIERQCRLIEDGFQDLGISVTVQNIVTGPTFSRIELSMDRSNGKSVKTMKNYASDIEMWLGCNGHVNILAPIPGKSCIGIEIPNKNRRIVGLKEVFNSPEFNNKKLKIPFALGVDIDNKAHACDIAKAPHLLIAGSTGSGKSVGISCLLNSILYRCSPEEVKLILIDPKKVELNDYEGLPHMLIEKPVCETNQVMNVLNWLVEEMERRYTALSEVHASKIDEYNEMMAEKKEPRMPYIVLVIDEVADLMMDLKKNLEDKINKLAAKSRAAGIHIVLATQRPSVDIITGSIKANLPSRIAFATVQVEDSKTILGSVGAEKLLRDGDMLYMNSSSPLLDRIQGAFISKKEVVAITNYVRENNPATFDEGIQSYIEKSGDDEQDNGDNAGGSASKPANGTDIDDRFIEALSAIIEEGHVSISLIQRKLGVGYPRAGKIYDQLTKCGYIKGNKVLITETQFNEMFGGEQ